ncbi:MAG: EAL domain-containing protein [Comamonadaceae bacterium]|nr:EAL domain-containing protein [Comamonadaceae bacterium]
MPSQIQAKYLTLCATAVVLAGAAALWPVITVRAVPPGVLPYIHLVAEMFAIAVSFMVVSIAWHNRHQKYAATVNLLVFGFTLVALLDLLHLLHYRGLPGNLAGAGVGQSLFFQQAARAVEAMMLLGLALLTNTQGGTVTGGNKRYWLLGALACAAVLLLIGVSAPGVPGLFYREGRGATALGMATQSLIGGINLLCALVLLQHWRTWHWVASLQIATVCFLLSVAQFTLIGNLGTLDSTDVVAHLLKAAAYALIYRLFYDQGVLHPQQRLEQSRQALARTNHDMTSIFEEMPCELVQLDTRLHYRYANPLHTRRMGCALEELVGTPWLTRLAPRQREIAQAQLEAALRGRHTEFDLREGDASAITSSFTVRASPQRGYDGMPEGVLITLIDTTEQESTRLMTAASLHEASELQAALDAHAIVSITDANGVITRVNDKFCAVSQYRRSELIGQTHDLIRSGMHTRDYFESINTALAAGKVWSGEMCSRARDGSLFWTYTTIVPFASQGGATAQHITIRTDITQRKQAEQQAQQLALYDALTGLPNRRLIESHIRQACSASARSGKFSAVMLLDLDNFKEINDTQGHDQGDELLRHVAERLRANLRASDTIARLGGDEFVVLVNELSTEPSRAGEEALAIAEKIRSALESTFNLNGRSAHTSLSIGISLFQGTDALHEEILKHADMALYRAKARGRNQVSLFDPALRVEVEHNASLMADLRVALERGEMHLHYQVIVDRDQRPLGYEALLRWVHPTRGSVPPLSYIDKAEQSGLIIALGTWVLRTACAELARWAQDPAMAHHILTVNISARQFRAPDFTAIVEAALTDTGADPHRLCLELTEGMFHADVTQSIARMRQISALGVRFALDDFGTGYSSLGYLRRMPLDMIKVDKSFVDDVLTDPNAAAIAQTILGLADTLELRVVAEGIEQQAQFEWFKARHCDAFQGYLFGRPAPLETVHGTEPTP